MVYRVNGSGSPLLYNTKNNDAVKANGFAVAGKQQNFDTSDFAAALNEEQTRIKDVVGSISQKAHIRPTFNELEAIKNTVDSGAYAINSEEIAARMLLMSV